MEEKGKATVKEIIGNPNKADDVNPTSITAEEVARVMKRIWLRHKLGLKQSGNNMFMVELPPPTKEDLTPSANSDSSDPDL